MVVKNIIRTVAEYLDLKDVLKYLDNKIEENEEMLDDINSLLLAVNMTNNTIAASYLELTSIKKVDVTDEIVEYNEISDKSIIEIKRIQTLGGSKINFKILPEGLKVYHYGICEIEYTYFPEKVGLDNEINHYLKLNELTFAMGVASEYLYIKGSIDDAYMWDKKFKNSMFNLLRPKRNIVMPARRW